MIEKVLNRKNLYKAYRQVVRNKGSAGVDGMKITGLFSYLESNRVRIATSILNHTYVPQPIRGRTKRELRARLWGAYPRATEKPDYLGFPQ
jgi:retron-type reverse transcriptase